MTILNTNTYSLVENQYRLKNARNFLNNISNTSYNLYGFAGYAIPFTTINSSANTIQTPTPDIQTSFTDVWKNMLFGKRIASNVASLMINQYIWQANTIYTQYDDTDPNLLNEQFYVHVNDTSYIHCFKCLYNNQNSFSTVTPNISDVNTSDSLFITADGYMWKYMYSVDSSTVTTFGTSTMIPIVPNNSVSNNAISGAIDVINVINTGMGYNNYTNGTFSIADTRLNGNNTIYSIDNSYYPSSVNTFYNGCILYITSGTGAGQYSNIINYTVNTITHFVQLENEFSIVPQNGSEYIIAPGITIIGDGTETNEAVGIAVINSSSGNIISSVLMLENGIGYKTANCFVNSSNVVPVVINAVVRAIQSPQGGHGYDAASELGCNTLCISLSFANTELGTIPSNGSYRQIGLLENPLFTSASIGISNQVGTFITGETISVYNYIKISNSTTVNNTSNIINVPYGDLLNQLYVGESIVLIGSGQQQISTVNSITNSTVFSITSNCNFSCTNTILGICNITSNSIAGGSSLGLLNVSNINNQFYENQNLIGWTSAAYGSIANVTISNVVKGFNTFVQMNAYDGYYTVGQFIEGEQVYQTSNTIFGYYDSSVIISNTITRFYISNQNGIFDYGTKLYGVNSGAIAYINSSYNPELIYGSGDILYIQNQMQIQRQQTLSETFKINLYF